MNVSGRPQYFSWGWGGSSTGSKVLKLLPSLLSPPLHLHLSLQISLSLSDLWHLWFVQPNVILLRASLMSFLGHVYASCHCLFHWPHQLFTIQVLPCSWEIRFFTFYPCPLKWDIQDHLWVCVQAIQNKNIWRKYLTKTSFKYCTWRIFPSSGKFIAGLMRM